MAPSLGAEPLKALVFVGLNGPLKHEADLRKFAERWIKEGNMLPSTEHANEVSRRLRSMESGAIAGRGADFSDLQGIRERVFAPGRQGLRDRMQHGDDEETEPTPALAPRPADNGPAFVAGFNLLGADAEARRGAAAAATQRRERRRQQDEAAAGAGAGAAAAAAAAAQ